MNDTYIARNAQTCTEIDVCWRHRRGHSALCNTWPYRAMQAAAPAAAVLSDAFVAERSLQALPGQGEVCQGKQLSVLYHCTSLNCTVAYGGQARNRGRAVKQGRQVKYA